MDAGLISMLAGLMKGKSAKAQFERQQALEEPVNKMKQDLIRLQLQKEKTALEETKIKSNLMNVFLNRYTQQQATQPAAPADASFNGAVEDAKSGKKGVADKMVDMDPMFAAIMKSVSGIDFLGAGRLNAQLDSNDRLTRQGDERIGISRDMLGERRRANDLRENEIKYMPITVPGKGTFNVQVPKFGGTGGPSLNIQTSPADKQEAIPQAELPLWVNTKTLETPPVGMTPIEAQDAGYKRVTTGQKDVVNSMGSVSKIIDQIRGLMDSVYPKTENFSERITGGVSRYVGAKTQTNTEAAKLQKLLKGTLAPIIRSLGEKGALSDGDVKRAIELFPALTDDADVAWGAIEQIQNILDGAKDQALGVSGTADFVFNPQTGKLEPAR